MIRNFEITAIDQTEFWKRFQTGYDRTHCARTPWRILLHSSCRLWVLPSRSFAVSNGTKGL